MSDVARHMSTVVPTAAEAVAVAGSHRRFSMKIVFGSYLFLERYVSIPSCLVMFLVHNNIVLKAKNSNQNAKLTISSSSRQSFRH